MKRFFKNAGAALALWLVIAFLFLGGAASGNTDNASPDDGFGGSGAISLPDVPPLPGIMPLDDWDYEECI